MVAVRAAAARRRDGAEPDAARPPARRVHGHVGQVLLVAAHRDHSERSQSIIIRKHKHKHKHNELTPDCDYDKSAKAQDKQEAEEEHAEHHQLPHLVHGPGAPLPREQRLARPPPQRRGDDGARARQARPPEHAHHVARQRSRAQHPVRLQRQLAPLHLHHHHHHHYYFQQKRREQQSRQSGGQVGGDAATTGAAETRHDETRSAVARRSAHPSRDRPLACDDNRWCRFASASSRQQQRGRVAHGQRVRAQRTDRPLLARRRAACSKRRRE